MDGTVLFLNIHENMFRIMLSALKHLMFLSSLIFYFGSW